MLDSYFDTAEVESEVATRHARAAIEPGDTLMRCMLEHVDYGLALVHIGTRRLDFANTPAMLAMRGPGASSSGLHLMEGRIDTLHGRDARQLDHVLTLARNGVRGLLNLATQAAKTTVAVVPLASPASHDTALLLFARRQLCDGSTMALYARSCGLTAAESKVLGSVCSGLRPQQIALHHNVQVSTVRSQLSSIRQKTRSGSVRELLETIARLPPIARHIG